MEGPPAIDAPVEAVHFHLAPADLAPVADWWLQHRYRFVTPVKKTFRRDVVAGTILTVVVLTGLALITTQTGAGALLIVVAIMVLTFFLMKVAARDRLERPQRTSLLRVMEDSTDFGALSIQLAREHVRLGRSDGEVVITWLEIDAVDATDDFVCLWRGRTSALVVPHHAFKSVGALRAFGEIAKRLHKESGHGEAQRIGELLERIDLPCPRCRYNLRGVRATHCPECGKPFDLDELEALANQPTPDAR